MNIRFRQLHGFMAAARLKSFSDAAREIAMTQPSFSQLIRDLEVSLRVKLFERTTRHVELTDAGRQLLGNIERPLDQLEGAYKLMHDIAAGKHGRIVFASAGYGFVVIALAQFKARFPSTMVRLIEEQSAISIERVVNNDVEFAIGSFATPRSELVFKKIVDDELMVVYPSDHPLAKRKRISWRNLASEALVLPPQQSNIRSLVEKHFRSIGVKCEPDYEVANKGAAVSMARAKLGVTFLPRIVLDELNMSGLRASRIAEPRPTRAIGVIRRNDRPLGGVAAAYVELVSSVARAQSI
jgi:LysR family transcriptional regulator, carnitine catabolism transcriptional activator